MVKKNADAYKAAQSDVEETAGLTITGSGHHIMLDIANKTAAEAIVGWLDGA